MPKSWLFFVLLLASCASTPSTSTAPKPGPEPAPEIERTGVTMDLSGEWNDVDSDLIAMAMIRDCLSHVWLDQWSKAHGGRSPVLRLYPIRNRTVSYIDYRYFTKQIEQALLNSGRIEVLVAADEADPKAGETGADFILNGWILSQDDRANNQELRAYLTSIEIIDVESNKKVWVGQKRIRKLLTKPAP